MLAPTYHISASHAIIGDRTTFFQIRQYAYQAMLCSESITATDPQGLLQNGLLMSTVSLLKDYRKFLFKYT